MFSYLFMVRWMPYASGIIGGMVEICMDDCRGSTHYIPGLQWDNQDVRVNVLGKLEAKISKGKNRGAHALDVIRDHDVFFL